MVDLKKKKKRLKEVKRSYEGKLINVRLFTYKRSRLNPFLHDNVFWHLWSTTYLEILRKMEYLLQKSKCSIFHNIFKSIQNLMYFFLVFFFTMLSKNRKLCHDLKNSLWSKGLNDCSLFRFRKSGINDSWRSTATERRKLLMKTMVMIMSACCFMVPHSYQQLYRKALMRDMLTLVACLEQVNIFYNKKWEY